MSNEEIKKIEEKECKCEFCKFFKKVLVIALGTFIGFYCAMSLFFATHKPPMMPQHHNFHKKPHIERSADSFRGEHHKMRGQRPPIEMENKN